MADTSGGSQEKKNDAKSIIKNLGNLNKVIIEALVNAQKLDSNNAPTELNTKVIKERLDAFAALIGDKGTISAILNNLANFSGNGSNYDKKSLDNAKKMVTSLDGLIVEINALTKLDPSKLQTSESSNGVSNEVIKGLNDIKTNLDAFGSEQYKLDGATINVPELFKCFSDNKSPLNVLIKDAKAVLTKSSRAVTNMNDEIRKLDNSLESLVVASTSNISSKSNEVVQKIIGTIQVVKDVFEGIGKSRADLEYFIGKTAQSNDSNGNAITLMEQVVNELVTKTNSSGEVEESVKSTKKYVQNGKSEFQLILGQLTGAITSIKKISGVVDSYIKVFADSSGRPTTTGRIKHWQNAVTPIRERWSLVFGDDKSISGMIKQSIHDASSFNPNIPKNMVAPSGAKSLFADKMDKVKKAVTEIKKINKPTDELVNLFAVKDGGKIIKSSSARMQEINKEVKDITGTLRSQILGSGGAMSKIMGLLTTIVGEANSWVVDDFFKSHEKRDEHGDVVKKDDGKPEMVNSLFATKIDDVKNAIKSIGKLNDIFKNVNLTAITLQSSLGSEYYKNLGWLHNNLLNGKKGPIQQSLNLLKSIDQFMTDGARLKLISDLKANADKEPAKQKKDGSFAHTSGCPWWETIGKTVAIIKGIQTLSQIPKEVNATHKKLSEMDNNIDVKKLVPQITKMTKDLVNQIGDGLEGINEVIMQSSMATVDKNTADSLNTTNTVLRSISDLVNTIVTAGEQMEEYGYRRLVHASIQIEFFIEILSTTLDELGDTSKELIANTPANLATAKKIEAALEPITDTYETLQKLFGILDGTKIMPTPLLKMKAKLMKNRIRNGIILMNGILGELQAEIQAIAPSESEKMEQFNDILEPVQSIFELVDTINKTPLPNLALFKIRAIRLRRRVLMVAELLVELQAELNNIAHGTNTDTRIVRKVQATMNAIKDMVEVFSSIAGDSLRILAKGKAITPAVKMMIKQFDMFDKLIDRISKLKDTRKANNQLRRLEEVVRSIAILATSMILLVPILALFILVSPVLILGVLVFALVTKVVVMLAKTTATSKTILLIIAVTLIIGAFIAMAAMMLVLVLVVDKLKDGIGLIIGFVVGIIAFMAVLALLGLGVQYVAPFIAMAVLGIVLVTIAVGAILVMAICLKLLEFIDLDTEAIKSNVKVVIDTALECMMLAFGPQSDPRGPNQDTSFLDVIGGVLVNIIRALAASIILVLTCISVVAILVIAAMLRLLAVIDPKEMEKGAENAKTAIKTATDIMTMLFDSDNPKGKDGESNSVFGSLLTYVFEPLGKILKAIFAYYYLGIMVIAMGLVLLLCTMIRLIANFDTGKITDGKENARLTVQAAAEIVADLFKGDDTDRTPSDRGGLLCVVGYVFGKEYEDIIRAVLAIAYVGVLILALVMISFLAKQLATIGEIDNGVLQKAKENAVLVVKTCGEIMNTIFSGDSDADTNEGEGWFKKMLKWVLPNSLVDMIDAIVKIGKLALLVIAVGAIGKLADQLTTLAKFKVSSSLAKQKAKNVIDAATTLVVNLKSLSKDADVDEDDMGKIYDLCVGLAKIPAGLQPIADNLTKLDSYKPEAIESAGLTGIKIISTMKQMVEDINDINCDVDGVNARLDIIDRISKTVGSFVKVEAEDVKNSKDLTDNYIKFFKQVDSMDLKKLQHTDWLMRSWASISRDLKGDFEGLAKTINQHIMPMLEKVNETLEKTTKAQQDIINTLSQPVDINGVGSTGGSALDFNTSTPGTSAPGGGFEPTGSAQPGNTAAPKNPSGAPQLNGGSRSQNTNLEPGKKYRIIVAESKEGW